MACVDQAPVTKEYKLLRLRSYLSGEALAAIESLGHSAIAYDSALERLERKFGGECRLFAAQMEKFERFPVVKAGDSQQLEKLADLLDLTVINLKETGRDSELGDGILYSTSLRRLPEGLVTQFQRWLFENSKPPSLIQLRDFLNREAEFLTVAQEATAGLSSERRLRSGLPNVSRDFPSSPPEADGPSSSQCLAVVVAEVENQLKQLTVEERSSFVFEKRLCFNCLKPGHSARRCRSRQRCATCNWRHHSLLHVDRSVPPRSHPTHSATNSLEVMSSSVTHGESVVFLMTASVPVSGSGAQATTRVFFDLGSQASFVSSDLVKRVKLKLLGKRRLELTAFEAEPTVSLVNVWEIGLVGLDGTHHSVQVLERPRIEMKIPAVPSPVAQRWKQRGISLADGPDTGEVEILLGADYANNFLQDKVTVDKEVVWRTTFGWVLSGGSSRQPETSVQVAYVGTPTEQPLERSTKWPAFPTPIEDNRNTVAMTKEGSSSTTLRVVFKAIWILLFVCAAVCAVHLELVDGSSADDFILAYRRFGARYGTPGLIRSDNGTGFVAAARTLSSTVKWVFNPPPPPPPPY